MRILGSRLLVLLFVATAVGTPVKSKLREDAGSERPRTGGHSNKRQEIIYLQGDISKRNRKEESMAFLERHGKSLTSEGRMANKTPTGSVYQDVKEYHRSSFEVLSADKNKGPPETADAANAKSDAYEVVNEHSNSADKSGASTDHESLEHSTNSATTENHVSEAQHEDGAGFHIVSLNTEKRPAVDKDEKASSSPSSYGNDEKVYGTIESRPVASISQSSQPGSDQDEQKHDNQNNNDFIPSSIVSVGQQDIMPSLPGSAAERQMYEAPSNQQQRFYPHFPVYRPYRFQGTPYWPRGSQRPHFMARHHTPAFSYAPFYPKRDQSQISPFTSQAPLDVYPLNQQNYPARPYIGFADDEGARKQLIQSMFSLPFVEAQSSPLIPAQINGPRFPIPQRPEIRSPIFQMQPLIQQVPATPFVPQMSEPGPLMMPASPQMAASLSQQQAFTAPLLQSRWADSPGYSRSEVLDNSEEGKAHHNENDSEEDIVPNERPEDEEDNYEGRREEHSREPETYHEDEQTREYEEQETDRTDERPEDEPVEEEYSEEDAVQRSNDPYDNDEERDPDEAASRYPEPSSNSERPEPETYREQSYSSDNVQNNFPEERSSSMDTLDERQPESLPSDQVFGRYPARPMEPHRDMYQMFSRIQRAQPKMEVSQMSSSQAQFLENKERRDPMDYFGPVSKNTIPKRTKYVKSGLENVLIRLNGKPLEDSTALRSKIIDGRIVEGKGKLIRSKGPVNVRMSHTNDAKHTKIIDIISPQKYKVYDTKSKITKPVPMITTGHSTS